MPGRTYNATAYRYGFNGQEKDNEVSVNGGTNTAMFWEYDTRLGRRWNLDPIPSAALSPYCAFDDNPISLTDVNGDTPWDKLVAGIKKVGGLAKSREIKSLKTGKRPHHGLDLATDYGTDIHAAAGGKVIHAGPMGGYGNAVIIDHGKGYVTVYAHMKKKDIKVKVGETVLNNQVIAKVGSEGGSTGPHLHVEYIYNPDGSNQAVGFKKGVKNTRVYDPRSINDLQDVIDGKEVFKGEFLSDNTSNSSYSPTSTTVKPKLRETTSTGSTNEGYSSNRESNVTQIQELSKDPVKNAAKLMELLGNPEKK